MKAIISKIVPADLRNRLEKSRLELLALFRGLDHSGLSAEEMPQKELRELMELDADCAEALWALDNPEGLSLKKMVRDTEASLRRIPNARQELLIKLPYQIPNQLVKRESQILMSLTLQDAYLNIPRRKFKA